LAELGRREEALAAIEEAVAIRRELAAARPDAFGPDLASSLNNQSNRLTALGRREDTLAASGRPGRGPPGRVWPAARKLLMIDEAIRQGIAETDLDGNSKPPPAKGLAETDYPKDIAAMANSGGGKVVYGITEKDKKATGAGEGTGELTERRAGLSQRCSYLDPSARIRSGYRAARRGGQSVHCCHRASQC